MREDLIKGMTALVLPVLSSLTNILPLTHCTKFSPAFFKRRHGSNAVGRWSPVATGEIPLWHFFLGNRICLQILFSFVPPVSKKKWINEFVHFNGLCFLIWTLSVTWVLLPLPMKQHHYLFVLSSTAFVGTKAESEIFCYRKM